MISLLVKRRETRIRLASRFVAFPSATVLRNTPLCGAKGDEPPAAPSRSSERWLPPDCRQGNRQPAAVSKLRQIHVLLDGVNLVLPRADGHRRHAMLDEPV